MKNTSIKILIILFMLISMNHLEAQVLKIELNQVELMKKFIGSWKGEFGEGSVFTSENNAFGDGIISNSQIITNGKIIESIAQLYGYDKKDDKFIIAELKEASSHIEICSTWFTSDSKGEIIITNPVGAPYSFTFEFITPDIIEQTAFHDGLVIQKIVLNRIKK